MFQLLKTILSLNRPTLLPLWYRLASTSTVLKRFHSPPHTNIFHSLHVVPWLPRSWVFHWGGDFIRHVSSFLYQQYDVTRSLFTGLWGKSCLSGLSTHPPIRARIHILLLWHFSKQTPSFSSFIFSRPLLRNIYVHCLERPVAPVHCCPLLRALILARSLYLSHPLLWPLGASSVF